MSCLKSSMDASPCAPASIILVVSESSSFPLSIIAERAILNPSKPTNGEISRAHCRVLSLGYVAIVRLRSLSVSAPSVRAKNTPACVSQ